MRAIGALVLALLANTANAWTVQCRGADGQLFEMSLSEYNEGGNRICGPVDTEHDAWRRARDKRLERCLVDWYDRASAGARAKQGDAPYRDCMRRANRQ